MNEDSNFKHQMNNLGIFPIKPWSLFQILTFYTLSVWKIERLNGISFGPAEMFRYHFIFSKSFRSKYRFLFQNNS